MPRGENPAFRERIGVLSEPLLHKNIRNHLRTRTDDRMDVESLDLSAFIDPDLTFDENWEVVERTLPVEGDGDISAADVEEGLERARFLWEKFKERHGISEDEVGC